MNMQEITCPHCGQKIPLTKALIESISKDLKEILRCPKCKGELEFKEDEHKIICQECRLIYPIKDDIPVMLIEEAETF